MEITLANNHAYSFEEVKAAENKGGSFVTYQWIIPLPLFYPVRRLSRVYFIPLGESKSQHAFQYNLISYIIGWWGLPWGPIFVVRSAKLNNGGGVDVSDDIYLNLDEKSYTKGRISLTKKATKFIHPPKAEIKEMVKVFKPLLKDQTIEKEPFVGTFIDTEKGIEPHVVIAFDEEMDNVTEEIITKAIYKRFYKKYAFELVELQSDFTEKEAYLKQALQLDCN